MKYRRSTALPHFVNLKSTARMTFLCCCDWRGIAGRIQLGDLRLILRSGRLPTVRSFPDAPWGMRWQGCGAGAGCGQEVGLYLAPRATRGGNSSMTLAGRVRNDNRPGLAGRRGGNGHCAAQFLHVFSFLFFYPVIPTRGNGAKETVVSPIRCARFGF